MGLYFPTPGPGQTSPTGPGPQARARKSPGGSTWRLQKSSSPGVSLWGLWFCLACDFGDTCRCRLQLITQYQVSGWPRTAGLAVLELPDPVDVEDMNGDACAKLPVALGPLAQWAVAELGFCLLHGHIAWQHL